jgi:hypothetical protein
VRRFTTIAVTAALLLTMNIGTASASPSNVRNYETLDLECDRLGDITVQIINLGNWGAAKVQGTRLTVIPRWFEFTATNLDTGETVIDGERVSQRNDTVDDVCRWSGEFYLERDPDFVDGTYSFEGAVGVRVVGRR